jgi:hypothetical protein
MTVRVLKTSTTAIEAKSQAQSGSPSPTWTTKFGQGPGIWRSLQAEGSQLLAGYSVVDLVVVELGDVKGVIGGIESV